MKKYKKTIITVSAVILILAVGLFGLYVGAGNYAYAEVYEFNVSADKLIEVVENLKKENHFSNPSNIEEPDSFDDLKSHFNVTMYCYKQNEIFCFIIDKNPNNSNQSAIKLVSINSELNVNSYKMVNRDLNRSENLKAKKDFKENILNKLKLPYSDKGNGMFIFWK